MSNCTFTTPDLNSGSEHQQKTVLAVIATSVVQMQDQDETNPSLVLHLYLLS